MDDLQQEENETDKDNKEKNNKMDVHTQGRNMEHWWRGCKIKREQDGKIKRAKMQEKTHNAVKKKKESQKKKDADS